MKACLSNGLSVNMIWSQTIAGINRRSSSTMTKNRAHGAQDPLRTTLGRVKEMTLQLRSWAI